MPVSGQLGVLIDGQWSVEYAVANLALVSTPTDTTGVSVSSYSSSQAIQSKLESGITKTGVQIAEYDPVVSALLAGEL